MTSRHRCSYLVRSGLLAFFLALIGSSEGQTVSPDQRQLERKFQMASAEYEAGHFADATAHLEDLLRQVPNSFEVHELLALAYSAESQDVRANEHFEKAVHLKPDSGAARTNLATNLARLGKYAPAEEQFQAAVKLEPHSFDANHNLGEFYVQARKISQATPFLERAQKVNPASYNNGYDLSLAYAETGKLSDAKQLIQSLLKEKDTAELHNLLAQVEEKDGQFVKAATQFELAAHMEPTESNLFDWASEMLLHRTLEPAIDIFRQGAERYPNSPRLAIGLGIALYSRGNYDEAVKSLLRAADLGPSDPRCYLFLSKAYDSSPVQAEEVIQRFRRFFELQPDNARAAYYYAISLWKGKRAQDPNVDFHQIETLLKKAVALDPKLSEAHFQLGNLLSDQAHYAEAIPEYLKALENNSDIPDAHYRLGQAYVHTSQKDKAQLELAVYQQQRAQHLADLDRQRAEIRQFVYSEGNGSSATQ